jgi:hypothetical protein
MQVARQVGGLVKTPYKVLTIAAGAELVLGGSVIGAELLATEGGTAIADPLIANSDKVLGQTDLYHDFGELVGREAMQSGELAVQNGSYVQWNVQGFINGTAGVFQYGGLLSPTGGVLYVTHTFFDEQ